MKKLIFVIALVTVLSIFGCVNVQTFIQNKDFFSLLIAFLALLIAFLAVCLTAWTMHSQNKHNRLSVKPIGAILVSDYEDKINVFLRNNGTGPLIITSYKIYNKIEKVHKSSIKAWMPPLPKNIVWSHYNLDITGWTLLPGKALILIELKGDDTDEKFTKFRNKVREMLRTLKVEIEYQCIYKKEIWKRERELDFFSRVKNG